MKNVSQAKVRTGLLHNSTSSASVEHSDADLFRTWSAFISTLQHVQCLLFFCHMRNASFQFKMNGLLPLYVGQFALRISDKKCGHCDCRGRTIYGHHITGGEAYWSGGGGISTKNEMQVRPFLENGYRRFIVMFTMAHICSYPEQMNPVHQRPSYFLQILLAFFPSPLDLSSCLFFSGFPIKTCMHRAIYSVMRATCCAHLIRHFIVIRRKGQGSKCKKK